MQYEKSGTLFANLTQSDVMFNLQMIVSLL